MSAGNPCWLAKDINAVRAKIRPNKTDAGSFTVGLNKKTAGALVPAVYVLNLSLKLLPIFLLPDN